MKSTIIKTLQVAFLLVIGFAFNGDLNAQATTVAEIAKDHETENEGWLVDLDEAYRLSAKTGKPIMANFTGSDWCGWCKKLTKSVFVHKEFKEWADKNVILLELDYPRRKALPGPLKQQNDGLKQAFQIRGFPTVWVFDLDKDAEGKFTIDPYGKTGYTKSPGEFISGVEQMFDKKKQGS